jgi:hypothetical protein
VASLANVVPLFQRLLKCTWHIFKTASKADLLDELFWAVNRKKSRAALAGRDRSYYEEVLKSSPDTFWSSAFREALTDFEGTVLSYYEDTVGTDRVHMLNQDPRPPRNHGISSTPTIMHTIIANTGVQWDCTSARWMTPLELLIVNGVPVNYKLGNLASPTGARCSSFCPGVSHARSSPRKRAAVAHQSGNTMNVMVSGVFLFYILGWIDLSSDPSVGARGAALVPNA